MMYNQMHQNSHNNKRIEVMVGCKTNTNLLQQWRNDKEASDNNSSIVKSKVQD